MATKLNATRITRITELIGFYRKKYHTGPGQPFCVGDDAGWVTQLIADLATSPETSFPWEQLKNDKISRRVFRALRGEFSRS